MALPKGLGLSVFSTVMFSCPSTLVPVITECILSVLYLYECPEQHYLTSTGQSWTPTCAHDWSLSHGHLHTITGFLRQESADFFG